LRPIHTPQVGAIEENAADDILMVNQGQQLVLTKEMEHITKRPDFSMFFFLNGGRLINNSSAGQGFGAPECDSAGKRCEDYPTE